MHLLNLLMDVMFLVQNSWISSKNLKTSCLSFSNLVIFNFWILEDVVLLSTERRQDKDPKQPISLTNFVSIFTSLRLLFHSLVLIKRKKIILESVDLFRKFCLLINLKSLVSVFLNFLEIVSNFKAIFFKSRLNHWKFIFQTFLHWIDCHKMNDKKSNHKQLNYWKFHVYYLIKLKHYWKLNFKEKWTFSGRNIGVRIILYEMEK